MSKRDAYLQAFADALSARGVNIDEIGGVTKASSYQNMHKDESGNMVVKELWSFQYAPVTFQAPAWEPISKAPIHILPDDKESKPLSNRFKTCVIIPDIQIGYFRSIDDKLVPIHDEDAISIALQIIKDVNPHLIVCNGDNLDFPEFSKYRTTPAFAQTTQASIDRAAMFAAQMRLAAPKARIVWLAGNHEERLPNYILDNAAAAFAIKKGLHPEGWPVMSVPYLCSFDKYKVEYVPGYPAGDFWINDNLKVIHGTKVKTGANTAHAYLRDEKVSVIYGHIHRVETAYKTRRDAKGSSTIMAASMGCLSRVDGAVPSMKGSKDLDGRPVKVSEDWQQGIGVITYQSTGDNKFSLETVPILNGWACYRGNVYTA